MVPAPMKPLAFITILRPANLLILGLAVGLGFWLGHAPGGAIACALLVAAAVCCAGFGNTVNDIADISTDSISHPLRPLAKADLSRKAAQFYAVFLALAACICAFLVSMPHFVGTVIPIVMLLLYAKFFKATPLVGNVLVSMLVAYGILFGALAGTGIHRLCVPALLAFLLNMCREIVKDVQDQQGDDAAGLITSASIARPILKNIIALCGMAYALLVFLPWVRHDFGIAYAIVCIAVVAPLHIAWTFLLYKKDLAASSAGISSLIKFELLAGLVALAADGFLTTIHF